MSEQQPDAAVEALAHVLWRADWLAGNGQGDRPYNTHYNMARAALTHQAAAFAKLGVQRDDAVESLVTERLEKHHKVVLGEREAEVDRLRRVAAAARGLVDYHTRWGWPVLSRGAPLLDELAEAVDALAPPPGAEEGGA